VKRFSAGLTMNLAVSLQQTVADALAGLADDPHAAASQLKATQNPAHGDYQVNCAMQLAKALGRKPRDVAEEIARRLASAPMLEAAEVAGPGFVNLRLKPAWLSGRLQDMARSERLGVEPAAKPKTVVIDYSGPNVAKPLHVGHLRSTIIGDALARLLRFLGHTAIGDNHLGDWGTQFGILIYGYKHHRDDAAYAADPVRELSRLYVHVRSLARLAAGEDEDAAANNPVVQAYRQETARLHAGDPENRALWRQFMPHCLEMLRPIYERLDIRFDHQLGESFYHDMLPGVTASLVAAAVASESRGALIVRQNPGDENSQVSIVRKGDGAYTYTTTDLATVRYRVETFKPDEILYVVDFRQADHFRTVFSVSRQWGLTGVGLEHVQFGSVMGPGGKPFQTREGGTIELMELLDEGVGQAARQYEAVRSQRVERGEDVPDLEPAEVRAIAEAVGVGAVKYADLSQNRTSNYIFDWDKMLAMDGNTAAYMQYAHARCRSIFRKAGVDDPTPFRTDPPAPSLATPHERALALQLLRFEEALAAAAADYKPNLLTGYLWDLAKAYSGFFQNCPVIKAETPELRHGRLLLCDLTARVIKQTLALLGIRSPERM
jgi:arginyl-tRNA synthetase